MTGPVVFARGKNALAICPRCSLQVPYYQLRKDGQNKNMVCLDCWDPKHPQEIPPRDIYDPMALRHPRVETLQNNDGFTLIAGNGGNTLYLEAVGQCAMTGFAGRFVGTVS